MLLYYTDYQVLIPGSVPDKKKTRAPHSIGPLPLQQIVRITHQYDSDYSPISEVLSSKIMYAPQKTNLEDGRLYKDYLPDRLGNSWTLPAGASSVLVECLRFSADRIKKSHNYMMCRYARVNTAQKQ